MLAVREPDVREVVAVETHDDEEPGAAQACRALRAFLFASSVSSRRWTASTRRRAVAQPANSSMLALEMNSLQGPSRRALRPSSCSSPAFLHADVRGERDVVFTQIRPVIVVFDTRHALGEYGASSVTPARPAPPVDSRWKASPRPRSPTGFPVNAFEGLQRLVACLSVLPIQPFPQLRSGNRVTYPAVGRDAELVAAPTAWTGPRCSCWHSRTPEDGSPDACPTSRGPRPRARGGHDHPSARVRPVRGITMPSLEA